MKKYLYYFKRFNLGSIKTMFHIAKEVRKKSKKHFILIDMIRCFIKYQCAFYDYLEFEFYDLNNEERSTFLTNGINNQIVSKFNNKEYFHILDNKDEFNDYFKEFIKRDYLPIKHTEKEFNDFIKDKDEVIIKPVDGIGGEGIKIVSPKEASKYQNYLMEEVIKQHKKMSALYDKSVNSIRVFSFFDGKDVYIMQSILKIGNNTVVDNFSSGGMYAFLSDDGVVITPAIDKDDNIYGKHPITNTQILGFKVPKFNELKTMIDKAARLIPEVKYIGWDVAITEKGPVLIEGNSYPGVFQIKPRFTKDRKGILPKYKEIMKI